jgi:hypothetical protein
MILLKVFPVSKSAPENATPLGANFMILLMFFQMRQKPLSSAKSRS